LKQREVLVKCSHTDLPSKYEHYLIDEETCGAVVKRLKRRTEGTVLGSFSGSFNGFGNALKPNSQSAEEEYPILDRVQKSMELSPLSRKSSMDVNSVYEQHDMKKLMQMMLENQTRITNLEQLFKDMITSRIVNDDSRELAILGEQVDTLTRDTAYKFNHLYQKLNDTGSQDHY